MAHPCRANQALLLLKKEVELCKLQADIGKRVEEKISKDQRRYFLMEQVSPGTSNEFRVRWANRGGGTTFHANSNLVCWGSGCCGSTPLGCSP